MYKDYEYWYKSNQNLIEHLAEHNSLLYRRYSDIFEVLNYVKDLEPEKVDSDLEVIFDEGFAYIFDRINYLKEYLNDNFIGDLHAFLKYEVLVNYYLYVEDMIDVFEREEMELKPVKASFDEIQNRISDIVNNRKQYDESIIKEFDTIMESVLPAGKEMLTVPEIFNRVQEEIIIKKGQEGIG